MDKKYYEKFETEICKLTDFLDQYEFIANAHTNDFITKDIWREVQAHFHLNQKEKQDEYFEECETFSTITCCYGNFKREHFKYCVGYNEKGESNIHHSDHRALNKSDSVGETKRKLNSFVNVKKEHELDFLVPLIDEVSNDLPCKKVSDSFIFLFIYIYQYQFLEVTNCCYNSNAEVLFPSSKLLSTRFG